MGAREGVLAVFGAYCPILRAILGRNLAEAVPVRQVQLGRKIENRGYRRPGVGGGAVSAPAVQERRKGAREGVWAGFGAYGRSYGRFWAEI